MEADIMTLKEMNKTVKAIADEKSLAELKNSARAELEKELARAKAELNKRIADFENAKNLDEMCERAFAKGTTKSYIETIENIMKG